MKTLELKVSDTILDRVLHVLHSFPSQDVHIIQKDNHDLQAELLLALRNVQKSAQKTDLDQMSDTEINAEIAAVRQGF